MSQQVFDPRAFVLKSSFFARSVLKNQLLLLIQANLQTEKGEVYRITASCYIEICRRGSGGLGRLGK